MSKAFTIKEVKQTIYSGNPSTNEPGNKKGDFNWNFLNKEIVFFGMGLPDRIKEIFYLELSTLLSAGLDMRTALELIVHEQEKNKYKIIIDRIYQSVISGSTLSSALELNNEFTAYEYQSIRIGEEVGKLATVLNDLAIYFQKKIKQHQQVIGALTYPVIVIVVAIVAVGFMALYVVPMFADVFKRFGGDLPLVTKAVLYAATLVKQFAAGVFFSFFAFFSFCILNRKKRWLRMSFSRAVLRLPLIGEITQKVYLSRFCTTMALLMVASIPMVRAIELVKEMIGYYPIEVSLNQIEDNIMHGLSLHKSMEPHDIYPKKMVSLIRAGEEVNKLELFFLKIAQQYNAEVEYKTTMLSKFIEPLIVVILGLIVGVILIAMYLPLFKLGQAF